MSRRVRLPSSARQRAASSLSIGTADTPGRGKHNHKTGFIAAFCSLRLAYFDTSRNTVDNGSDLRHIASMKIDDAAAHLEALGNPTRLKIYRTLIRAGGAGMPVGHLQDRL